MNPVRLEFAQAADGTSRLLAHCQAKGPEKARLLIVQALGEEMNFTRRVVSALALGLADHGISTRWIDPVGTGDSADGPALDLDAWFNDLDLAVNPWLADTDVPLAALGVRAGVFLGAAWLNTRGQGVPLFSLAAPADVAAWRSEITRKQRLAAMLGKASRPEVPPGMVEALGARALAPCTGISAPELDALGAWWQQAEPVEAAPFVPLVVNALGTALGTASSPSAQGSALTQEVALLSASAELAPGVIETPVYGNGWCGIGCAPASAPRACVLIVAGQPQTRSGALRMFTLLARFLAQRGIASLRIDLPGWGDNPGVPRAFDGYSRELTDAIQALAARHPGRPLFAFGLCDGASALMLAAPVIAKRARMSGLVLLNPWLRSEVTRDRALLAHHYKAQFSPQNLLRRVLHGELGLAQIRGFLGHAWGAAKAGSDRDLDRFVAATQAHAWPLTVILSDADLTGQEGLLVLGSSAWAELAPRLKVERLPQADHVCSRLADFEALCVRVAEAMEPH